MSAVGISTHILDTARGKPAAGVSVVLEMRDGNTWKEAGKGVTDADGRIASLLASGPSSGDYRIRFATGHYFLAAGDPVFYPEVTIEVRFATAGGKYPLPLLLSPFGYSTYRGS